MNKLCRYILLFFSVTFWHICLNAQSEPQFTQFMFNRYLFNPAYAGHYDGLEVSAIHRSQYVSIANRYIATQGLNINAPIDVISSGIGLTAINDLIGFQRSTYVALNYDYRKKFKWGKMGIGIGAGFIQTSIAGDKLRAPEGDYNGGVNHNDNFLPNSLQQGIAPDFSFGIYFNSEKYFAGASLNHIALSSAAVKSESGGKTKLNFSRNLFFTGGYDFQISQKFSIMPSAIIKTDLKKVQVDIGLTTTIINNIIAGISFRGYTKKTIDALAIVLGFKYKGVQLAYSYDANLSYLTKFNTGSHEIGLSYRYPFKKKESRGYFYRNPRYN
ncbi:MAG TPA: PorP/SprF family type IX secretion system membrane protein [Chitinophagales bacterium]|nr:PorP/SprF family type IX secretion system membrane protein [Chitinophagales bacterium]